jgi:hypothetical protein
MIFGSKTGYGSEQPKPPDHINRGVCYRWLILQVIVDAANTPFRERRKVRAAVFRLQIVKTAIVNLTAGGFQFGPLRGLRLVLLNYLMRPQDIM